MGIIQAPGMQAAPWAIQPTPGQVPGGMTFGAHSSLQPYRLNAWTGRVEGGFMAAERTEGRQGEFGVTELDIELEFSGLYMPGWISSFTQMLLEDAEPEDSRTRLLEKIERQFHRNGLNVLETWGEFMMVAVEKMAR